MEILGYTADTTDPAGGIIQRKPGGREPNCVLEETPWLNGIPKLLANVGPEGLRAFAKAGAELWASYGYTTAQEGRSIPGTAKLLKAVADGGGFKIDVVTYPDVLVDRDFIKSGVSRGYTNRFRIGGAKLTIDGSPQGFTAWRDKPYYAPVGNYPPGYSGLPNSMRVLDAAVTRRTRSGDILVRRSACLSWRASKPSRCGPLISISRRRTKTPSRTANLLIS